MKNEIAIVLVTYNPDISNIHKILNELSYHYHIYIYDNDSDNVEQIIKVTSSFDNLTLIFGKKNIGIATAQNKCIEKILTKKNAKYVFFLDQDSFITDSNLVKLENDIKILQKNNPRIGVLAASIDKLVSSDNVFKQLNEVISSGMLIPISVFLKVGVMRDNFFIDMVDYDWCWRAKNKGYEVVKDNEIILEHQIGDTQKVLGRIYVAPFREYYVFRNTIYLLRNANYLPDNYKIKLKFFLLKQGIFNTIFCPDKKERIKFILKGIKDGVNEKMGKLDEK